MKQLSKNEIKDLQIRILDVVSSFCDKNGIKYWLDFGTLIGAIRHNGYIPWDDDIDIGMLRPDFEKFIQSFNGYDERYEVRCIDNDPDFYFAFGKVLDKKTILHELGENGFTMSVNIDIFVYDNAPDNKGSLRTLYNRRDFFRNCNQLRVYRNPPSGCFIRKWFIWVLRLMLLPFPKNFFAKKLSENAQRYALEKTEGIGNFTGYARMYCKKSIFDSIILHEFEDKFYKIPARYDDWLKIFYGNYMEIPPKEERVSHHSFTAYIKE